MIIMSITESCLKSMITTMIMLSMESIMIFSWIIIISFKMSIFILRMLFWSCKD